MKHITYIAIFFVSTLSYAQEAHTISGHLLDFESNNEALIFAKITIKENGMEVLTDEHGYFKFNNLEDGEYTLVCSFVGYETKETKMTIASNRSNIRWLMKPSTISLEDLNSLMANVGNSASSNTTN